MSGYPKFEAVSATDYKSKRQPLSGYHLGFTEHKSYAVKIKTGPRCRGFISVARYSSMQSAESAARRKKSTELKGEDRG